MTEYTLLADLCESRLIPSRPSLRSWGADKLAEVAYLYFLAVRVLIGDAATHAWAKHYCARTIQANNFDAWRSDGTDFYVLLHALGGAAHPNDNKRAISASAVREWFHHLHGKDIDGPTQRLFNRLDAMLRVTDSALKAMRRLVSHWSHANGRERQDTLGKLIHRLQRLAPNSELLGHLKTVMKSLGTDSAIGESASAGATGTASVASSVGGLGCGFERDGDGLERSIYGKKNPVVFLKTTGKGEEKAKTNKQRPSELA